MIDTRVVHVKVVGGHFVTVLPPAEQSAADDVVWRVPKAGARHSFMRHVQTHDGVTALLDYTQTRADKRDTL